MTAPHKRPHRHPKYKTAYGVKNWREYAQALRHRGDITFLAIETALTLRLLFHLPLRHTEGLLSSILTLLGVSLPYPDHTTLSRRHPTVAMRQQGERTPHSPRHHFIYTSAESRQLCWVGLRPEI